MASLTSRPPEVGPDTAADPGPDLAPELVPDEVILTPADYQLPEYVPAAFRQTMERRKQNVKVTREQIVFFGERGVTWTEIEKFYGVDRLAIMRFYRGDYERGVANVNIFLKSKMVELALKGNPTMLIWVSKNRLGWGDAGQRDGAAADGGAPTAADVKFVPLTPENKDGEWKA